MWDEATRRLTAMGLRSLRHGNGHLTFSLPVDVEYGTDREEGAIYAQGILQPEKSRGFELGPWTPAGDESWKTHNRNRASFRKAQKKSGKIEDEA
jgi:hypothetical protein